MTTDNSDGIAAFLLACAAMVGTDKVVSAADAQNLYGRNTVHHQTRIAGAVRAQTEEQVIAIVTAANTHRVGLYPISTGHNWGYGGATPHVDDSVVLDLSAMRRIISVDPLLGVAVIEPGVTTGQLYEYLEANHLPYLVPVTGAGPTNSLIGNALERGFGITPTPDHFQAVYSLRAVLADGRIYESAHAGASTHINHYYKWGIGPYLDGIFSQGSFGVITQASIALAPRHDVTGIFSLRFDDADLDDAVNYLREVTKRYGGNLSSAQILSRARIIATNPSSSPRHLSDWNMFLFVHGDTLQVNNIKRQLRRMCSISRRHCEFITTRKILALHRFCSSLPARLKRISIFKELDFAAQVAGLLQGKPSIAFIKNMLYRNKKTQSHDSAINPDQDGIGIYWYSPLVPMKSENVRQFIDFSQPILQSHGFAFSVTMTGFSWHCFDCTISLIYNHADAADSARAKSCYEALLSEGMDRGFMPYRVGLQGMKSVVNENHVFWQVGKAIKQVLDPNKILSAGRYTLS